MNKTSKIVTVVGARPQFIKAAPVSRALKAQGIEECLVHTGQHYDHNMSEAFFEELGISAPNHHLGIAGGGHGQMTGQMLEKIEKLLVLEKPDAVLVYGDTNSTLAGSLAAVKMHIPIIHIEAGLRSFNRRMPEEINRLLTDHISNLMLCTSPVALENLDKEGITEGVHDVGDVMADACQDAVSRTEKNLDELLLKMGVPSEKRGKYWVLTCHRAENTDSEERMKSIFSALEASEVPIIFPIHPRTKKVIADMNLPLPKNVTTIEPVGHGEMIALMRGGVGVLTDSGGLQKEAYWVKRSCITLRSETEWIETVHSGWNVLVDADGEKILTSIKNPPAADEHPSLYGDGKASERCAEIISKFLG